MVFFSFTLSSLILWHCTIALRIKYKTCREAKSKTYTDPYNYVSYDGCGVSLFCDDLSDDLYETVDSNNGLIIDAGSWATITITVDTSTYDSDIDCLYYDDTKVIKKNTMYRFEYDDTDSDSCGCKYIGSTIFCYDCKIWMCSDDQPTLCTSADGTPAPTPEPTPAQLTTFNDFCERDYSSGLNEAVQICGMIDLNNILNEEQSMLFHNNGLEIYELQTDILWKDRMPYLLIVYLDNLEKRVYSDIFDSEGNHIVSNHIIVDIFGDENNELEDIEVLVKELESDSYQDIIQFMVIYRYDYDDVLKYSLSVFNGESISNIYQEHEFNPSIIDDTDLWLYYYSSSYLFKNDAFVLFGRETSSTASVIVLDLDGNVLNENGINFEIDYVGSDGFGSTKYGISCGFNTTHDICMLNYVEGTSSSTEYSLGAIIAIQIADIAHISVIKDEFNIDYNSNYKVDDGYKPVVIGPAYDRYFMQIGGMDYDCCPWFMSAAVYDLNGNVIVNEFSFSDDTIYGADCYSTFQSGVIICETGSDMYLYDSNGNALIDNPGLFLNEEELNNYITENYPQKYAEFGDITDLSEVRLVPLTSNDFWVVFYAEITNYDNDIILAIKMSLYTECCDVYTQSESEDGEDDGIMGGIGTVSLNGKDIPLTIVYITVAGVIVIICIALLACYCVKCKTNSPKASKSKSLSPRGAPKYQNVFEQDQNELVKDTELNRTELETLQ